MPCEGEAKMSFVHATGGQDLKNPELQTDIGRG